jgi:nitrite reductase (cytochrome c-552)
MIEAIAEAKEAGASDEQLEPIRQLHRKAQWRLGLRLFRELVGFHAPQEAARILAESIDYSRQAVALAKVAAANPEGTPRDVERAPVEGITPEEEAPRCRKAHGSV